MPSSKPTLGVNDLQSQFPDIAKEWHPTRNGDLKPMEVTRSSRKKVWWQCSTHPDHEWVSSIGDRTGKGQGCPISSGNKTLEGFNDLQSLAPEVAKEWHPMMKGKLKPKQFSKRSRKKVWWQCSAHPDHEWVSTIDSRTGQGKGCPICAGKKVLDDLYEHHWGDVTYGC